MKRSLCRLFSAGGLLAGVLLLGTTGCSKSDIGNLDGPLLIQALQAYHKDAVSRGEDIPEQIATITLLERGLLTIDDLRPLEGYYIDIPSTNFPLSGVTPDTVIVHAHNDAGDVVEIRANGSIVLASDSDSP